MFKLRHIVTMPFSLNLTLKLKIISLSCREFRASFSINIRRWMDILSIRKWHELMHLGKWLCMRATRPVCASSYRINDDRFLEWLWLLSCTLNNKYFAHTKWMHSVNASEIHGRILLFQKMRWWWWWCLLPTIQMKPMEKKLGVANCR